MSESRVSVPRPRIQGLSDLIFGLALSIGSVQLLVYSPKGGYDILTSLVVFGFSFLILINVWLRYTSLTSVVPIETTGMVRLNVLLLFLVAIEPYLFDIMVKSGLSLDPGLDASAFYALDIGGMNLVIAYFTHLMTLEERKLIPADLVRRYKQSRNAIFLVALIFVLSSIPSLGSTSLLGTSLRVILWIATVPLIWVSRIASKGPA